MPNLRLPRTLWRVVATGGARHYWEPASMTYAREDWARAKAQQYLDRGALEVRIYRSEQTWEDVTSQ